MITYITAFVFENEFENTEEWALISDRLLYTPAQYMDTCEANTISEQLENLRRKQLVLKRDISHSQTKHTESSQELPRSQLPFDNRKVFIVHGHDDLVKVSVARTLDNAGFEAIILHEQASGGQTIIEKIVENADVNFAVVLYTECDLGRSKKDARTEEKYRARQNVVFEHGYLIGKLGRKRVCALIKGDVETPGDFAGVVYLPMDNTDAWKISLAKEMKKAGFIVDMNTFCK